ncbi:MAG: hypothetical protein M3N08_10760 [Pseudomonadota bacterium]|nr:hypothetical protein [Pseudomonadota bacterium]
MSYPEDLIPQESGSDALSGLSLQRREELVANAIVYCVKKGYSAFMLKEFDNDAFAARERITREAVELTNFYATGIRKGVTEITASFYETGDTLTVPRPVAPGADGIAASLVSAFQSVSLERPKKLNDAFKLLKGLRPQ